MANAPSSVLTYGGDQASGPYQLRAPNDRPARLRLLLASADGAATIYLGEGDDTSQPVTIGGNSLGNAGTATGWRGLIIPFAAGGVVGLDAAEIPAGELMTMTVKASAGVHAYLSVQWLTDAPQASAINSARGGIQATAKQTAGDNAVWKLGINHNRDHVEHQDREPQGRKRPFPKPWDVGPNRSM